MPFLFVLEKMKNSFKLKITAFCFLVLAVLGVFAISAPQALAIFINSPYVLVLNATVLSVGGSNLSVSTPGTGTFVINTNARTVFTGVSSLSGLTTGTQVRIIATRQGNLYMAQVIQKTASSGYGVPPPPPPTLTPSPTPRPSLAQVADGTIIGKTANTITVQNDSMNATFSVTGSTLFIRKTFAALLIGDRVFVSGKNTGTSFVAQIVIYRSSSSIH